MNWYLAKIIFRIICGEGDHTAQFDEQLRLIAADNEELALQKAQQMGRSEEESFPNQQQQMVQWMFINVAELYQLRELMDGAELYSRIQEYDEAENYISTVHKKAMHIREASTHKILQLL